ncbi:MAG: efflux RND transporter periplasmic adaptor subunit [Pseudomonadota bacterium]
MSLPSKSVRRNALRRAEKRRDVALSEPLEATIRSIPAAPDVSVGRQIIYSIVQIALAVVIVLVGFTVYNRIIDTAPSAKRNPPQRIARLVDVEIVKAATTGPIIEAWGEVSAAQTLIVRPEISGMIAWVHPEITPGGRVTAGTVVARFDDIDLQLALSQAETDIAEIDARILLEEGQAEIGRRELTRLSRNLTQEQRDLVLRKPQMAQLQAQRAAAVALRDQALNAVERAEVIAPFDAIVLSETVAPGAMLAQGTEVATFVAADQFHVTMALPPSALSWISLDGTQTVTLRKDGVWPEGETRSGRIVRLSSQLSQTGRMAEVIVEVPDPLGTKPALLLGSFVKGTVEAPAISGAVALKRANLRDDDTVWVMTPDDKLAIRPVDVVWRGADKVLVTDGLAPGDRVVETLLSTFTEGMSLRTRAEPNS